MGSDEAYQRICDDVCTMGREALEHELLHFPGDVPLDFSPDYLTRQPLERLQHLLVAALWQGYVKQLATGVAAHA